MRVRAAGSAVTGFPDPNQKVLCPFRIEPRRVIDAQPIELLSGHSATVAGRPLRDAQFDLAFVEQSEDQFSSERDFRIEGHGRVRSVQPPHGFPESLIALEAKRVE